MLLQDGCVLNIICNIYYVKMWKYISRRIRDTFERSANHFDKRGSAVINPSNSNITEDKNINPPCCWFSARKCWNSFESGNDTNNNRWNFEQLNRSWIGAITWSSALVFGWYTSQLIHFSFKKQDIEKKRNGFHKNRFLLECLPFLASIGKRDLKPLNIQSQFEDPLFNNPPIVHLISNDQNEECDPNSSTTTCTSSSQKSENDLGEVLNSIENKLGLAAIESGQHQDGLNLLRSAAHRNHAPALYNLGLCYELGLGVVVNEKMAMELYRSAAALKHPGALYNLGIYYGQGRGGLAKDRATAIRLLRLAAIQGQEAAVTALKSIEEDFSTPQPLPNKLLHDNIIPTHSALFCDSVNSLQACNYKYEPSIC